jgi:hypothetical protein
MGIHYQLIQNITQPQLSGRKKGRRIYILKNMDNPTYIYFEK